MAAPNYSERVLEDDPLAYWRCAVASGDIPDVTGNGRTMPWTAIDFSGGFNPYRRATLVQDDADYAIFVDDPPLDPSADVSYGNLTTGTFWQLAGDFTLECWFNGDQWDYVYGDTIRRIFGTDDIWLGVVLRDPALVAPKFTPALYVRLAGGDPFDPTICADETLTVALDTPIHIVGTRSGNTLKLYVNGTLAATLGIAATANRATSSRIVIGSFGTLNNVPGVIDECAIYDHALSASRVFIHYTMPELKIIGRFEGETGRSTERLVWDHGSGNTPSALVGHSEGTRHLKLTYVAPDRSGDSRFMVTDPEDGDASKTWQQYLLDFHGYRMVDGSPFNVTDERGTTDKFCFVGNNANDITFTKIGPGLYRAELMVRQYRDADGT